MDIKIAIDTAKQVSMAEGITDSTENIFNILIKHLIKIGKRMIMVFAFRGGLSRRTSNVNIEVTLSTKKDKKLLDSNVACTAAN